jgi:hypothetical protein
MSTYDERVERAIAEAEAEAMRSPLACAMRAHPEWRDVLIKELHVPNRQAARRRYRAAADAAEQCGLDEYRTGTRWTLERFKVAYDVALVSVEEKERKQHEEWLKRETEHRAQKAQQTPLAQPFAARLVNGISQLCNFVVVLAVSVWGMGMFVLWIGLTLLVGLAIVVWAFRVLFA